MVVELGAGRYATMASPEASTTGSVLGLYPLAKARARLARIFASLESRRLFRLAIGAGRLAGRLRFVLPASIRTMLDLLPASAISSRPFPVLTPAAGYRRARVALLAGCVQDVLSPGINEAAIRVLW